MQRPSWRPRIGPPEVSARDGLLAVAIGVAAERSIREGRPIDMAELGF
jgi:myo-inositol 2-dehydrogenase/D-chiro-inositol 1-dehydrogenase